MKVPTATYRLQFRNRMDFDRAASLVPYLAKLDISHLYASPIFQATAGSTHGYDVVDHNVLDPSLGGREGFERLHAALKEAGIGLLLDIVPNHMAASLENPWWRDVLQWGEESRFSRHFDIDWSRKLTLPILGKPLEAALADNELAPVLEDEAGTLALAYFDNRFPLHPESWKTVLAPFDIPLAKELVEAAAQADPGFPARLHEHVRSSRYGATELSQAMLGHARNADYVRSIHAAQPWELIFWKEANHNLSYRRFFEVTGLAGVRVEDEQVFQDVHRLTLELVREGKVDGLRIDHVDGLADPKGYLSRLRQAVGEDTYIIVEKILVGDENLPPDWPLQGTSGYEFIDMMADVLPSPEGMRKLSQAYERQTTSGDTVSIRRAAKRQILEHNFAGEVDRLADLLSRVMDAPPNLREALLALLAVMPVYRTYGAGASMPERDRAILDAAVDEASRMSPPLAEAIADVASFLKGDAPSNDVETARLARYRFEQLSGPAMAKGVEDTLFYRDHRFLALNEVGCDPSHPAGNLERFHRRMGERVERHDHSLSATSTHDTKRGEDARARLHALSEAPDAWTESVERWRRINASGLSPELEWMIYQALAGVWSHPLKEDDLPALRDRFMDYLQKALREGKQRTSWTEVDEPYENTVRLYASRLLDNAEFRQDFSRTLEPFIIAGHHNSLTQTLLKLTAPGIPDIYQGAEAEDLSLVDPDNRRSPDFAALEDMLGSSGGFPAHKQYMIARLSHARRQRPALFNEGDYQPLTISGHLSRHLVAYTRSVSDGHLLVVAPRLTLGLLDEEGTFGSNFLEQVEISIPPHLRDKLFSSLLEENSTAPIRMGQTLDKSLLAKQPWLVLMH